ncbi:hypothetical protein EV360DRAFT_87083 [Lentinula raphanica]|nr:hypothetical protein EV360DRAFT_87083 [Lentinula raphanica]
MPSFSPEQLQFLAGLPSELSSGVLEGQIPFHTVLMAALNTSSPPSTISPSSSTTSCCLYRFWTSNAFSSKSTNSVHFSSSIHIGEEPMGLEDVSAVVLNHVLDIPVSFLTET